MDGYLIVWYVNDSKYHHLLEDNSSLTLGRQRRASDPLGFDEKSDRLNLPNDWRSVARQQLGLHCQDKELHLSNLSQTRSVELLLIRKQEKYRLKPQGQISFKPQNIDLQFGNVVLKVRPVKKGAAHSEHLHKHYRREEKLLSDDGIFFMSEPTIFIFKSALTNEDS